MRIARLGIVGAGTMGGGIAALAASAGIPVTLLDIPGKVGAKRNGPASEGLERARKSRPPAFMDASRASIVAIGNTEDDLGRLADCDLVIEAIIEQLEPKRALYTQLEKILPKHALIASNTSGIPMALLTEGRSGSFKKRFLGMHFFNPPRYLHLLEIIPTPDTATATFETAREFSDRILGKGIVIAKDVPGFVANRLGVFGMVLAIRLMEKYGFSIDEADTLTGPLLARAKSATYRTADLSGIDVIAHVTKELAEATGEDFALSSWVLDLVKAGRLGEKSGAGFYQKAKGAGGKTEIQTLNWRTGQYEPQKSIESPELKKMLKLPLPDRFAALKEWKGPHGDFTREYLLTFSQYVLKTTPIVAYDIPSVDHAMEWGYAWDIGPFKQMDLLGAQFLKDGFAKLGIELPELLKSGPPFFDPRTAETIPLEGSATKKPKKSADSPVSLVALRRSAAADEKTAKKLRLFDSHDATVWQVQDVAILEIHSKMNTLGRGALEGVARALDLTEENDLAGLVIGNEDPRAFSAGADLFMVLGLIQAGDWKTLAQAVETFQQTSLRIRGSPFPVVAAAAGLTLAGGCEFALHCDAIQAHAELYMGLVEVGVGLIPAGGGTTEMLFRFSADLAPYAEADPFEAAKRAFGIIAMATTSTSALEARNLGYLRPGDRITMNRDRLLSDAVDRVRDLSVDYVAPLPRTITALGKEALGNLHYGVWAMREGGQITDHEVRIANELAYVLAGGDGPPRIVTETDLFALEREAFMRLLGTKETQERMKYMLENGKPLRN